MMERDDIARWELFWAIKLGQIKAEDCLVNYEQIHANGFEEVRSQLEGWSKDFEGVWSRHYASLRKKSGDLNLFSALFPSPIADLVENAGLDYSTRLSSFRETIIGNERKYLKYRLADNMLVSIYDWDDDVMPWLKLETAVRIIFKKASVASPFNRAPKWFPEVYLSTEASEYNVIDAISSMHIQDDLEPAAQTYQEVLEPRWDRHNSNLLHFFFGEYDCLDRTLIIYLDRIAALENRMQDVGDEVLNFNRNDIFYIALSVGYGYWLAQDFGLIPSAIFREMEQWHHLWMLGFATQIIEAFGNISFFRAGIIPAMSHTYSKLIERNPKVFDPALKFSVKEQKFTFLCELPDFTTIMNSDEDYSRQHKIACEAQRRLEMPEQMNIFLSKAGMIPSDDYKMESFQNRQ